MDPQTPPLQKTSGTLEVDANRTIVATTAGTSVFAFKVLAGALGFAILAYLGWKLNGVDKRQLKGEPLQRPEPAHTEEK